MLNRRNRWLPAAVVAAVLALGAGAALAASRTTDDGFLAGVAKRLGISEDTLKSAIQDEATARIDEAVKNGTLTQEQANRLKERAKSGAGLGPLGIPPLGRAFGPGPGRGFGLGFGHVFRGLGDQIDAAAEYLGVTPAELRTELQGGKTLSEVAKAHDKSVDGLKTAMKKALRSDLDQAVDDGTLTKEQADNLYAKLAPGIDELVDAVAGFRLPKLDGRDFKLPGLGFALPGLAPGLGGGSVGKAVTSYLGLTEAQLREKLAGGDSLSEIAKAQGKSVDGLKSAIKKALRADLDQAVDNGALTKSQADSLYGHLAEGVDRLVDNGGGLGFRLHFRGPGFDFRFGPDERRQDTTPPAPQGSSSNGASLQLQVF
jgi:ribosomal protein S20